MRGVGVVVHTAVEDGGGVLADPPGNESAATGVLVDERRHVVHDTGHDNQATGFGLLQKVVPLDNRQLLDGCAPAEGGAFLVEALELLLVPTLFDLVVGEGLELLWLSASRSVSEAGRRIATYIICQAGELHDVDKDLCGVILVPFEGVAVVGGELVLQNKRVRSWLKVDGDGI